MTKLEKFEKREGGPTECWSAFGTRTFKNAVGEDCKCFAAVRTIAEAGGWRIDFCHAVAGTWCPWEPITTEVFTTRILALKAIRVWAKTH